MSKVSNVIRSSAVAAALLVSFVALLVSAAQDQAGLRRMLTSKLEEKFLTACEWFTDFDLAKKESKDTGKPIFAYFTRSFDY